MLSIVNRFRYFLLISCLIFSFYSLNYYEGSKILYLIFNFTLILLVYLLTNFSSSFFSFFLAFYIFMGFWFKYNFSLVLNEGYVFDSGQLKSNDIDNVLFLSLCIFITIILAHLISIFFSYNKFDLQKKKNIFSSKYFQFKYLIVLLFVILIASNGYLNYSLKIYIKGLIFENNYNFLLTNITKWILMFGLTTISCFILNKEIISKSKISIFFIILILFELLVSYTSMLSRSILLFGLPFIYSYLFYHKIINNIFQKYFFFIIIFITFSVISIYSSNYLRLSHVNKLKDDVKIQYDLFTEGKNDDLSIEKTENFKNSQKFNFQIDEVLVEENSKPTAKKTTLFILINRWVGIDSLINVSKSNELSFNLFFSAFKEIKENSGNSFYENKFNLENKKPSFYSNNIYVKGNTLPGLFTFFYYSGSILFLIISTFVVIIFFCYLERKIYLLTNKNIFYTAFFSHYIVNRIFSFGYAPRDTYLLILSLIFSVILIYFFETSRFDKILSNLK